MTNNKNMMEDYHLPGNPMPEYPEPQTESEAAPAPNGSGGRVLIGCALVAFSILVLAGVELYIFRHKSAAPQAAAPENTLAQKIAPSAGIELPVTWGDVGKQMVEVGVIDQAKFESLYAARGGMQPEIKALLTEDKNARIRITQANASALLNILWALGLGNKNPILTTGEMVSPTYGGAGTFASTGGWTLAKGKAMDHYSMHPFVVLDAAAQDKVERVTQNIYRPCCGNSTHFPDCNHGMAMLGLMQLMAAEGASEEEMYKTALTVNSYWFPDVYLTLAHYVQSQGLDWKKIPPKDILGAGFSSAQGYARIKALVPAGPSTGGASGCGVDAPPAASQSSGGCGV